MANFKILYITLNLANTQHTSQYSNFNTFNYIPRTTPLTDDMQDLVMWKDRDFLFLVISSPSPGKCQSRLSVLFKTYRIMVAGEL